MDRLHEMPCRVAGALFCAVFLLAPAAAEDIATIRATFADPPRQFSSAPLWVWNDMLTEQQVVESLRDLAAQKVKQAFVHPRPGLMTPYLSADWFRLWRAALAEAKRLDMNLWIYDENSYPSGFAGGLVPDAMPEARGRSLVARNVKGAEALRKALAPSPPAPLPQRGEGSSRGPTPLPKMENEETVVAVFRLDGPKYDDVTAEARSGKALPEAHYLVLSVVRSPATPWNAGKTYVDLMYPGVTQKFLDITLGAYQREIGAEFGRRVPGSFCDEPHLEAGGGVPWTDDLPQVFQKRWGYDLRGSLPSLFREVGDWRRVRHNYYQVLSDLFIERWSKPYHDYCEQHGLEWTGHYWDHAWPICTTVPDNMAMYAWHQRPAIDCLMNQYHEDTHAQFGNARMVRELASVANQMGRPRTLCEAYGAGGWDMRLEDMKRIGDWLFALGVNTLDQHLSYVTIRGARKRDHPQSFSYHEPWWGDYHVLAQYFTRLSYALSRGRTENHILVIEPTTTAWMYQNGSDAKTREHLKEIGDKFQEFLLKLEDRQIEYDIGSEDIIARHGSIESCETPHQDSPRPLAGEGPGVRAPGSAKTPNQFQRPRFAVGQRRYSMLVIPPAIESLNQKTASLLNEFAGRGGTVLSYDVDELTEIDGRRATSNERAHFPAGLDCTIQYSADYSRSGILRTEGDQGKLFHLRRQLDDGQLLFLVNTSIDSPSRGRISADANGVEQWNPESGGVCPYPFKNERQGISLSYYLPPCGSLLLFLSNKPLPAAKEPSGTWATIPPGSPPTVHRDEPNVLTLDYCDLTAGGQTNKNIYCYQANRMVFQAAGFERNPWDSAVQFRDELIRRKLPADTSVDATYRFTIEKAVPRTLEIVVERPDLYAITCNGKPCRPRTGRWWLDKAFGRIDLGAAARVGENAVTLHAAPINIYHEIEPAYLLGDFTLRAAAAGFVVTPGGTLRVGPEGWNAQGHPFYASGVTYAGSFDVAAPAGRYRVVLPKWYGSVARVTVNGKLVGRMVHQSWECEVSEAIRPGANRIEVTVVGTLKNTLGPHHGQPPLGAAWPASFQKAPQSGPPPGSQYDTVAYGLFQPFALEQWHNRP